MAEPKLRRVERLSPGSLAGPKHTRDYAVTPAVLNEPLPQIEWIDPGRLLVDGVYQRDLSSKSITLIRKIVAEWSWRKFKPPIVTQTDKGYVVIDGQHTATAAVTHGKIDKIPVMVVAAPSQREQAAGFIGHNRDRVNVTPMQLFFSAMAAEEAGAMTVKHVCDAAGITIVKYPGSQGFQPNTTVAVQAISKLVAKRYTMETRRILGILARTESAPITSNQIKAVEALLFDAEFKGVANDSLIGETIKGLGPRADREAIVLAATHGLPVWKALTITYFRAMRPKLKRAV